MTKFLPLFPLLLSACGPVAYLPIETLGPTPGMQAEAVDAELRVGAEWVEVHLHNRGASPVRVRWDAASFTEPGGAYHPLISSARVAQLHTRSAMMHMTRQAYESAGPLGRLTAFQASGHRISPVLEEQTQEVEMVLKPGQSASEVLYPAEHAQVDETGTMQVSGLFCRDRVGSRSAKQEFEVRVPVQREGRWELITLTARLLPTAPAARHSPTP